MPEYQRWKNIMKCYPFEEKRLAKWSPPYIIQPKYDGIRCRALPLADGDFLLLSSEENPIFSVPHINKVLQSNLPRYEYDGELYCHGMKFEEIISITSRTVNLHDNFHLINYHLFDIVDEEKSQTSRLGKLAGLNKNIRKSGCLQLAPFYLCDSLDDIMEVYDGFLNSGYEGIIVRHHLAPYEKKRSIWLMKFKPKKEDTYEIIDAVEEISIDGVPKGSLGALVCKSGDGNAFKVGTGFTQDQRRALWKDVQSLRGKKVKVGYQHLTDRKVPRFPVFITILEKGE